MASTHAGILTKGIELSYGAIASSGTQTYTALTNLQEIPEIGNNAPEKVDVTVLSDDAKHSIDGLKDSAQDLTFKFLYEESQFTTLSGLTGEQAWKVTLPSSSGGSTGKSAKFTGTCSVKMDSAGVGAALTYSVTVALTSLVTYA